MNFTELQKIVDTALEKRLSHAGFRCVLAGTWNRQNCQDLNVIWLQKHSSEAKFCLNLGVHYSFLPKAGTEEAISSDMIEFADCELKIRLTEQPTIRDQWWPISLESANKVVDLISNRGLTSFEAYHASGAISNIEPKDIESGNAGLLAPLTKVRACLLLARMHESMGNLEKCRDAAIIGIKLAGMAVGPKKVLRDILKRCEQGV